MHNYPSDITMEQFKLIELELESVRKKTKPREVSLYSVFCAVLYLLKSACQWRMIPSDYPKWKTVYSYFKIWSEEKEDGRTLLAEVLEKLVADVRAQDNRKKRRVYVS